MMTLNTFYRDIKQFQDWGFDLLKCVTVSPLWLYLIFLLRYDNCAVPFDNITRENIIGSTFFSFGGIVLTRSLITYRSGRVHADVQRHQGFVPDVRQTHDFIVFM